MGIKTSFYRFKEHGELTFGPKTFQLDIRPLILVLGLKGNEAKSRKKEIVEVFSVTLGHRGLLTEKKIRYILSEMIFQ